MSVYYELYQHEDPKFPVLFLRHKAEHQYMWNDVQWHEAIEMLFVKKGEIRVLVDGEMMRGHPGDLIVINSNRLHSVESMDGSTVFYCLRIDKHMMDEFFSESDVVMFKQHVSDEFLHSLFDLIADEVYSKKEYFRISAKGMIMQLCVYLWRKYRVEAKANSGKDSQKVAAVKDAIKYLRANCEERMDVSDISEHVGYSKFYFSRIFKEYTGMSIVEFLNYERCNRADEMMSDGMSVGAAASFCGFNNMSYFTRTFRKYKGRVPSSKKK